MKNLFKRLFSATQEDQKKPVVKLATDMEQVKKVSVLDTIIEANERYINALFGIHTNQE